MQAPQSLGHANKELVTSAAGAALGSWGLAWPHSLGAATSCSVPDLDAKGLQPAPTLEAPPNRFRTEIDSKAASWTDAALQMT